MKPIIIKNTFYLLVLRILNPLISMVLFIAISRSLGPEILGQFAFMITLTGIFCVGSMMGLQPLIIRAVTNNKEDVSPFLSSTILIGSSSSIFMIMLMNMSLPFFNLSSELKYYLFILSFSLVPTTMSYFFESFFMAFEKMNLILYEQIIPNIFKVGASLFIIWRGGDLLYVVIIIFISSVVSLIICIHLFNRHISKISFKIDLKFVLDLIKASPTFLFISIDFCYKVGIVKLLILPDK